MALFKNMAITYKGMALFAKAQAGQPITFTKMRVGSGELGTRDPAVLTSLVDGKLDVPISSISPNSELKSATIVGSVNNTGLLEAVYICEIGIYANDPDEGEILYGYSNCGNFGDYYAPESQGPYTWQYQISVAIGNAANVTVELTELNFDYGLVNSNTSFLVLSGGNQKEINKNIDLKLKSHDDSIASVSTQMADTTKILSYATASGTNTYTVTIDGISALVEGMSVKIKFTNANTGASTLNINSLGAKSIRKGIGTALSSGNIKAGQIVHLVYTGTVFQLLGEGGEYGTATAGDVLSGKTIGTEAGLINGTLALTGDATVADVISGKTFYSADAKSKLTGIATIASLGGKRFASGTLTLTIIPDQTFGTVQRAVVSGLSFLPSIIYVWAQKNIRDTYYKPDLSGFGKDMALNGLDYNAFACGNGVVAEYKLGTAMHSLGTQTYVVNGGFSLSLYQPQQSNYNWLAVE